MTMIDRIGRFRGVPTSGVMEESTGGFPQFVVDFAATEYYDVETQTWIDWTPYQQTMKAYLILFNASKALLNYEQVMKAFNWDGADMGQLQRDDFGDLIVQFEVKENVYKEKINLRIEWIDSGDGNPLSGGGSTLTPMDTGKLKALSAKYGQFMKVAPKIAPVRGGSLPTPPPVAVATPPVAPAAPLPVVPVVGEGITQQAAWAGLCEVNALLAKAAQLDEDALGSIFLTVTDEVAAGVGRSEAELTNLDWNSVLSTAAQSITE